MWQLFCYTASCRVGLTFHTTRIFIAPNTLKEDPDGPTLLIKLSTMTNEMPILEEAVTVMPDGEMVVQSFDEFYSYAHQKLVAVCREDDRDEHLSQQKFNFLARELQGRPDKMILYSMTQFLKCPLFVTGGLDNVF